jgi:hypothetical protein
MKTINLRVEKRGLMDVPIYDDHQRAKNWGANIEPDPHAPGGMARDFWDRARGEMFYYVIPENLRFLIPCAIEFGADRLTWSGKRRPDRWYGVAVEMTDKRLTVVECASPRAAVDLVEELRNPAEKEETPEGERDAN